MLKVAVTGGAGSGKTAVCSRLKALGLAVVSADDMAKEAVVPGAEALKKIVGVFGKKLLLPDGTLNRKMLRQMITDDDAARMTLEKILHHEILTLVLKNVDRMEKQGCPMIVIEIPLLFELHLQDRFDWVIVVSANRELRIQRLMERDHISRDSAIKLIDIQMPDKQKVEQADDVVWNEGSREDLVRSVDALFNNLSDNVKRQKALDRH